MNSHTGQHASHPMNLLMNAAAAASHINSSASSSPNMDHKSGLCLTAEQQQHHFNPKPMGFPDINVLAQQRNSLSSSCSNSSTSSKSSSQNGLNQQQKQLQEAASYYQHNPSMNAALAALMTQYPQNAALGPLFNSSAIAAMSQVPGANPMQSLMNNLLNSLMNKDQSAGNC